MLPFAAPLAVAGGGGESAGIVVELQFPTFWVGQDSKAGPIAALIEQFNADHAGSISTTSRPRNSSRDSTNTLQLGIRFFVSQFFTDYTSMFAAITLAIIPSILVYILLHERIIRGLTAGAVKG